jgi:hypothetical protein
MLADTHPTAAMISCRPGKSSLSLADQKKTKCPYSFPDYRDPNDLKRISLGWSKSVGGYEVATGTHRVRLFINRVLLADFVGNSGLMVSFHDPDAV